MSEYVNGRIIKGIGGFYYVKPSDSSHLIECRARGIFRHQHIKPLVGDYVKISENKKEGMAIETIETRKNAFIRPPVANVDIAVIVFAAVNPEPNLLLLDKLLIASELNEVRPIICFTKTDLVDQATMNQLIEVYEQTPYTIILMNRDDVTGLKKLEKEIKGKTAFLAGPSGVGKSTLANRLCVKSQMETGELSQKLGRGKHTTRHVELLKLNAGGFLLDTPGFSSFQLDQAIEADMLRFYFPEFEEGQCRFNSCLHQSEPGCAVRKQAETGKINTMRYQHYLYLLEELKKKRNRK